MLEFSSTVIFTLCVPMYQLNLQAPAEIQLIRQTMPYIKQGYHLNNTHTHPFNGPFSGTTWVSQYQKGKTNLDYTEAKDSQ